MSSADQTQHHPDVSAQKRSDYPIDLSIFSGEGGEEKRELYTKVMNGDWDNVIKKYEENKEFFQTAIITNSKQTALHIAISSSLTDVVGKLLDNIDAPAIRDMIDNRKENPLHLAASLGQFETCKRLVVMDPKLLEAQNVEGETPLFLAVLHGKMEAFYAIHPKCPITGKDIKQARAHCKRNDGNHILHASIRGEYFDLIVDSDKVETSPYFTGKHCVDIACQVPENYPTCLDLLYLWKSIVSWARTCKILNRNMDRLPMRNTTPGERQETSNTDPIQDKKSQDSTKPCEHVHIDISGDKTEPQMGPLKEEGSGNSTPQEGNERQQCSSNSHVFLHFLQFAIELFLIVISLGSYRC